MDLVEPHDDASPEDRLRDRLLTAGVAPSEADPLLPIVLTTSGPRWWPNGLAMQELPEDARADAFVRIAAEAYLEASTPGAALFRLFVTCCLRGVVADSTGPLQERGNGGVAETVPPVVDVLLPAFLSAGLDPAAFVGRMPKEEHYLRDVLVAHPLLRAAIRPAAFLDMGSLRTWNRFKQRSQADAEGLERPECWVRVRGAGCLDDFLAIVVAEPSETACRVARAFLQAIGQPCWGFSGPLDDPAARPELHTRLALWVSHLAGRVAADPDGVEALGAYFEALSTLVRAGDGAVPEQLRVEAVRIADRALGRLRPLARENPGGVDALYRADKHEPQMSWAAALAALARHGGLAKALVAGAQLLRQLKEPAVARDLRWWDEAPLDAPPHRWRWLPMTLVGVVHGSGSIEEVSDPDLRSARMGLGQFLLDRLKRTKPADPLSPPMEPDATWRRCCIRALRELGGNPGGTGHQILHHVAQSDPDADVRDAAVTAYEELRRNPDEPGDVSPRRRLVAALWWLRQAHLLALGVDVDATGARRTRQTEISRTREKKNKDGITV